MSEISVDSRLSKAILNNKYRFELKPHLRGRDAFTFFAYALNITWRIQALACLFGLFLLIITYINLELIKLTINSVIDSGHFPIILLKNEVSQLELLIVSLAALMLVCLMLSVIRFLVNILQGLICERVLIALRRKIYASRARANSKKVGNGIIPVISQEIEPLGGFSGEMIILPLVQAGTFLTVLFFIFLQNNVLGVAVVALIPIQVIWSAWMQKKLNRFWRNRIRLMRLLAVRATILSSAPTGMERIFSNIYVNRMAIYRAKYLMKSANSYFIGVSSVVVIGVGGYLVMSDDLTVGVIAVTLGAHKDLSGSFRELLRYRQMWCDVSVRYLELKRSVGEEFAEA